MAELPSQEYLKSRIEYNPETGEVRWKPVATNGDWYKHRFNTTYANKLIGQRVRIDDVQYTTARLVYKIFYGRDPSGTLSYINNNRVDLRINNLQDRSCLENKLKESVTKLPPIEDIRPIPIDIDNLLKLDLKTGKIYWKPRGDTSFDSQYAGKEAGYYNGKYFSVTVKGTRYQFHRLVWALYYGTDPINYFIDHIDVNRGNNCVRNLRLANQSLNAHNKIGNKKFTTKNGTTYQTSIYVNRVSIFLGSYSSEQDAIDAYNKAEARYKPIYQFTEEEQAELDELYTNYPNVTRELQHRCHALQVKALNHYIEGATQ